ncbi:MAG TPA: phospholipase D-like domain-containing protein, partial [Burkholderiaceae bacterium]|nr:phospholipase D-like domain-containing protein [Burkholderiaceae bacterium]
MNTAAASAPLASPAVPPTAAHSRFVQRVRRRYGGLLDRLPAGMPDTTTLAALVDGLCAEGRPLGQALRIARQLLLERLVVLDTEQRAPLEAVTGAMTSLAELALDRALAQAGADLDRRYGAPLDAAGRRIEFWVVGMGKLGARELNVSSDIDLVYVYEEDGSTSGPQVVTAHEYFAQLARALYALVGETTDDGFVFRVDLALRPNGNSGPPVVSLAMLEEYFVVQGREWERFAWLKSRVVAPRASVDSRRALALRGTVTPFVYRRYLDYGVFEGLRQLHRKVREEAQRRAAGRPERANDVKLSRGGIREIEFIVQLLLVVRGGQYPEIRTRSTLRGLQRLAARGLMKAATAQRLAECYTFLRRVEHRIQYLDDQQTHLLPAADADLAWIAASLGLGSACELLAQLAVRAGEPPPLCCESVTLFTSGHPAYDAIVEAIDAAEHHVHLEYYIFSEGVVATRLRDALVRAARRGVEVRLLVDGLGSRTLPDSFLNPLLEAKAQVAVFNPMAFIHFRPTLMNFRTHRKIVTCDGCIGFTGGMNVEDGHDESVTGPSAWRDSHLRIAGDAVAALELVFLEDWTFATGSAPTGEAYVHAPTGRGGTLVQVVSSGPDLDAQFAIYKQYFAAISAARQRVFLTTPYFVPDEAIFMALVTAAQRGQDPPDLWEKL